MVAVADLGSGEGVQELVHVTNGLRAGLGLDALSQHVLDNLPEIAHD